jgi:tripartite-type tricarboxylate transporter receptor subunit TctC
LRRCLSSDYHLAGLLLASAASIDLVHVAYKGGAPALADLLGGQVQMGILIMSTVMPHVQSGKLRALGVVEASRAKAAPDLPTLAEGGIAGYAMPDLWIGFLGPRGLPAPVVTRINAAVIKAVNAPDVRPRLEAIGYEVGGNTPEQFADDCKKCRRLPQDRRCGRHQAGIVKKHFHPFRVLKVAVPKRMD